MYQYHFRAHLKVFVLLFERKIRGLVLFCGFNLVVEGSLSLAHKVCAGNRKETSFSTISASYNSNNEYKVFSFGDGSSGALGHVDDYLNHVYEPKEIVELPTNVSKLAAGHYHSFALTNDGALWAWGRNSEGQLGPRNKNTRQENSQPQSVTGLEGVNVKDAAGSGVVSMAVDNDGYVWAWGKSKRGQLGLGIGITESLVPQSLEALKHVHVVQVSLGWGHALALTKEGQVYSWGYSAHGRLGFPPERSKLEQSHFCLEKEESLRTISANQISCDGLEEESPMLVWKPQLVDSLKPYEITNIACGMDHSLALDASGHIWSFGDNVYDQLGRKSKVLVDSIECDIQKSQFVRVTAGLGHSLAILSDKEGSRKKTGTPDSSQFDVRVENAGIPYSWGWNIAAQLGRSYSSAVPMAVEELDDVTTLAGGRAHSLAITTDATLWAWGSGLNGRLGLGSSLNEQYPVPVESLGNHKILQAVCGFDHSLVLAH